jgi:hypothetical protein
VGSSPAAARTLAVMEVVVVLPCAPAMAMPYFKRINSPSISARGMTGIFSAVRLDDFRIVAANAEETTTTCAPCTCSALWPSKISAPIFCRRSVIADDFVSEPETE